MEKLEVKIVLDRGVKQPEYMTPGSAGMDVHARIGESITIKPLERKLISTGIKIAIPEGYEVQVRPRSGLALKHGITVLNTPGTIDSDYRNEIGVILINLSDKDYVLEPNERIAQLVFNKFEQVILDQVDILDETERTGGFGSTGK